MKIEIKKDQYKKSSDDTQAKLYLIHHMHHFGVGSSKDVRHELHHCFLFKKKDMKGEKYFVDHFVDGDYVYHHIKGIFEGTLYDHANNSYDIVKKNYVGDTIYFVNVGGPNE